MNQGIRMIVHPVKDIAQLKSLYTGLLGIEPYAETTYYVGLTGLIGHIEQQV
jgi:hypothetical protein